MKGAAPTQLPDGSPAAAWDLSGLWMQNSPPGAWLWGAESRVGGQYQGSPQ